MQKTHFSRQNAARKREYLVLTTLVENVEAENKVTLKIRKQAIYKEGAPHIHSIEKIEQMLISQNELPFDVLPGTLKQDVLEYEYLNQPTLEMELEKALLQKNWQLADELFKKGLELIRSLPTVTLQTHPDPTAYAELFGTAPDKESIFLSPGFTDITAGNIILSNPKPVLLDCEWVVSFPVERELVEVRYFWSLMATFSPLLLLYKDQVELLYDKKISKYVLKSWFELLGSPSAESLSQCFIKERGFQNYVLSFYQDVVPTSLDLKPYVKSSETQAQTGEFLQEYLSHKSEVDNLRTELTIIKNSKWWKLVTFIRNPITGIHRLWEKLNRTNANS